jgi:hypothetical protein
VIIAVTIKTERQLLTALFVELRFAMSVMKEHTAAVVSKKRRRKKAQRYCWQYS